MSPLRAHLRHRFSDAGRRDFRARLGAQSQPQPSDDFVTLGSRLVIRLYLTYPFLVGLLTGLVVAWLWHRCVTLWGRLLVP
jgi:hypothetical protein